MRSEHTIAVPLLHVIGFGCLVVGAMLVGASVVVGNGKVLLGGMGMFYTGMMALGTPRSHGPVTHFRGGHVPVLTVTYVSRVLSLQRPWARARISTLPLSG